jgi:hypothetical protein
VSAVVDVGDAIELTFTTVPGAAVSLSWLDRFGAPGILDEAVTENPAASGKFPVTLVAAPTDGLWTAFFTASGTTSATEKYYVRALSLSGPAPLAAVGDVADQYGTLTPAQESLTKYLIRAASALLRQRARQANLDIDADLAAGRLDPDVAALTVSNMVLRVLRNPNGLRAETTGPFSRTYDTTTAAGLLVLTDYDLAAITTAEAVPDGLAALGIGTIRVLPGLAPTPWYRRHGLGGRGGPYGGW